MNDLKALPVKSTGSPAKSGLSVFGKMLVTLMAVTILSCGKECIGPVGCHQPGTGICPPGKPCQNVPDPMGSCHPDTYVTVTNVGCGVGVWGANWLQLDNGDLLQPWLSNNTASVSPGQRYRISYGPAVRDTLYDSVITCMALVPFGTPIRVNCMEPVAVTSSAH